MKEIRSLILVLLFGVVAGAGLVALVSRGGEAAYRVEEILLSPELIGGAPLGDRDPETGVARVWHFEQLELDGGRIPPERYAAFFEKVKGLRSVEETSFQPVSTLVLKLEPGGRYGAAYARRSFQRVEFGADGATFRVELVGEAGGGWAYFHANDVRRFLG